MIKPQEKKTIVISSGEPAGIGPDLIVQYSDFLSQEQENTYFLVLADPDLLQQRAKLLGKKIDINYVNATNIHSSLINNRLNVLPILCVEPVIAGTLNTNNATYVMSMLDTAIELCQTKKTHAMVTCPIQKSVLLVRDLSYMGTLNI
jgi:4-hydroxythreonine-4-phosphate dehydrogenase